MLAPPMHEMDQSDKAKVETTSFTQLIWGKMQGKAKIGIKDGGGGALEACGHLQVQLESGD